jgi:hypothetical protein
MIALKLATVLFLASSVNCECKHSLTTVIGSKKPTQVCSGELIFEDNFDSVDLSKWKFENTMAGENHKHEAVKNNSN